MQPEEADKMASEEIVIRNFGTNHSSLDFWNSPEEDIYQDYLIMHDSK